MKTTSKKFIQFIGILSVGMMMNLAGCSKEFLPMEPEQNQKEVTFSAQNQSPTNQLKILTFQTGNKALGKKKKVSKKFTVQEGGILTLAVGDDIRAIEYINKQPPIRSKKLAKQLIKNSPLSASVLIAALGRQPQMQASHLFAVLKKNAPLSSQVLYAILAQKNRFERNQILRLLYASLPVPQDIWYQIKRMGLKEELLGKFNNRQNKGYRVGEDNKRNYGYPCAKVTFELEPGALEEDLDISICMDDEELAGDIFIEFGPHGIFFNEPATLNIEIFGLNFREIEDFEMEDLGLYYVNQETGLWERMKFENIIFEKGKGILKVINAELPHFSRYAIGSE